MVDVMVRVEPVRREWAEALAEGDAVFAQRFGIPVEAGWSGFPEALPILLQAATSGVPGEWGPQLFFDDDGALVGNGGWKGPPEQGRPSWGTRWRPPGSGEESPPRSCGNWPNAAAGRASGWLSRTRSRRTTRQPRCSPAAASPGPRNWTIPMKAGSGDGSCGCGCGPSQLRSYHPRRASGKLPGALPRAKASGQVAVNMRHGQLRAACCGARPLAPGVDPSRQATAPTPPVFAECPRMPR